MDRTTYNYNRAFSRMVRALHRFKAQARYCGKEVKSISMTIRRDASTSTHVTCHAPEPKRRKIKGPILVQPHPSGLSGEHNVVLDAIHQECLHGRA
jgi:hypothetical protein